jgi:hypothetical protein
MCQFKEQPQHELVVANASIEDLPKAKLKVDDPKGILHVGAKGGSAVSITSSSLAAHSIGEAV